MLRRFWSAYAFPGERQLHQHCSSRLMGHLPQERPHHCTIEEEFFCSPSFDELTCQSFLYCVDYGVIGRSAVAIDCRVGHCFSFGCEIDCEIDCDIDCEICPVNDKKGYWTDCFDLSYVPFADFDYGIDSFSNLCPSICVKGCGSYYVSYLSFLCHVIETMIDYASSVRSNKYLFEAELGVPEVKQDLMVKIDFHLQSSVGAEKD